MVSFINIAFAVVKFKIFKSFAYRFSIQCSFWEVFGSLLPQIKSNIAEILTKGSTLAKKKFEVFFEGFEFLLKRNEPKFGIFGLTFTPCFPLTIAEVKNHGRKTSTVGLSKYVKMKALSPLSFPGKIRLLFPIFRLFLPGNRAGSEVKGLESKFDKTYFIHAIPVNFV